MLRSMTGFGKGGSEDSHGKARAEIKSLNYKFFEVVAKLPPQLMVFEDRIRDILQKKITRGRLSLFLGYEKTNGKKDEVLIDKDVARKYYRKITDLKKALRLGGDVRLEQIITLPGVISYRPQQEDIEKAWPLVSRAINAAADDLICSKAEEGKEIIKDVERLVNSIEKSVKKIRLRAPNVVKEYKKRLLANVKKLTGSGRTLNPERMEEEASIFARNSDISEETHRLSAHIASFKKVLLNDKEAGRRLDFIAQELHREVNTTGAKANDFPISKEVIKIKSLIEKIREQVQNVE